MRIMGIDFGDKRIGIALSDTFGWTAQGLETISYNNSFKEAVNRIMQIVKQYDVGKIVVGLPLNMNGTKGFRVDKTNEFIQELSKQTNIQIIKWDERLSSVIAGNVIKEMGKSPSKNKGLIDTISAAVILQSYLDSCN